MHDDSQLLRSKLFSGISPEELKTLLNCLGCREAFFRKGEVIVAEQENVRQVGLVLSGCVDMVKEDLWGGKALLMRMRESEVFGETFVCGADSRSLVTFVAAEDARVLLLPLERVMHSCSPACCFHRQMMENMMGLLAEKNRRLMHKAEIVSKHTLREKIQAYLSMQAQGTGYFEIPLGRMELAEYLCADRSALTRELARMKEEGLIDYDRNCFRIL